MKTEMEAKSKDTRGPLKTPHVDGGGESRFIPQCNGHERERGVFRRRGKIPMVKE